MTTISFARHQFPPDVIWHAVWLYLRFTLSFRDVEDLLADRGLDVSVGAASPSSGLMARRRPTRGADEGLLRPTPGPMGVLALDDMIVALVELDANGLGLQWRTHLGGTPPAHLPRWLLMKILAYRLQAAAFGGLDKETLRVLR
jgi:hypothetical protein